MSRLLSPRETAKGVSLDRATRHNALTGNICLPATLYRRNIVCLQEMAEASAQGCQIGLSGMGFGIGCSYLFLLTHCNGWNMEIELDVGAEDKIQLCARNLQQRERGLQWAAPQDYYWNLRGKIQFSGHRVNISFPTTQMDHAIDILNSLAVSQCRDCRKDQGGMKSALVLFILYDDLWPTLPVEASK